MKILANRVAGPRLPETNIHEASQREGHGEMGQGGRGNGNGEGEQRSNSAKLAEPLRTNRSPFVAFWKITNFLFSFFLSIGLKYKTVENK